MRARGPVLSAVLGLGLVVGAVGQCGGGEEEKAAAPARTEVRAPSPTLPAPPPEDPGENPFEDALDGDNDELDVLLEPAPTRDGAVVRVVDGDTVHVLVAGVDTTVRIIGLDTPEVYGGAECYGREASARARELLDGEVVRLEVDPSQDQVDRHGRVLGHVWLADGRLFSEVMVREGFAVEYLYDRVYAHRDRLVAAEAKAQANDVGLWGAC
ncbi:thermonuclease family protein [Actinopolymorpha sp. B9G3]|uniref:thermonuclease family protein n=1 Tax=Actinopolymorpha sp. B9G3 TaxID=3158970 RepID=UPI0032D8CD71